jgi:hypothetical protein
MIAAAVATFKDSIWPDISILIFSFDNFNISGLIPWLSLPKTKQHDFAGLNSDRLVPVCELVA